MKIEDSNRTICSKNRRNTVNPDSAHNRLYTNPGQRPLVWYGIASFEMIFYC